MRGIGKKALLHRACIAQMTQQAVEGTDDRRDLDRRAGSSSDRRSVGDRLSNSSAQAFQWAETLGNAKPRERDRPQGDEHGRRHCRHQNLTDKSIALVQRFSDLDHEDRRSIAMRLRGSSLPGSRHRRTCAVRRRSRGAAANREHRRRSCRPGSAPGKSPCRPDRKQAPRAPFAADRCARRIASSLTLSAMSNAGSSSERS